MADDALMMMQSLPLFYDEVNRTKERSVSAEDFIRRIEEMKHRYQWNEDRTAQMARSCMREEAENFFAFAATIDLSQADRLRMGTSFTDGFLPVFKKRFFKLKTSADITAQWLTIRQKDGERPSRFCSRVIGEVAKVGELLTTEAVATKPLTADILAGLNALPNDGAKQAFRDAIETFVQEHGRSQEDVSRRKIFKALQFTLVGNGLAHKELRSVVEDFQRKDKTITETMTKLSITEGQMGGAALGRKSQPSNPNQNQNPSNSNAERKKKKKNGNGVNEIDEHEDNEDANVDANKDMMKGRKRKPIDMSKLRCRNCQQLGHFAAKCKNPFKARDANAIENANQGGGGGQREDGMSAISSKNAWA
jgi:hypothetical protein